LAADFNKLQPLFLPNTGSRLGNTEPKPFVRFFIICASFIFSNRSSLTAGIIVVVYLHKDGGVLQQKNNARVSRAFGEC